MITALVITLTITIIALMIVDIASIPTFIVFLILKLCGVIDWQWLHVCIPLIVFAGTTVLTGITRAVSAVVSVKADME